MGLTLANYCNSLFIISAANGGKTGPSFVRVVGNAQFLIAPLHLQLPQLNVIDLGAVDVIVVSNYMSARTHAHTPIHTHTHTHTHTTHIQIHIDTNTQ